jgi:hypothetical protein
MEVILVVASACGAIAAVLVFLRYGVVLGVLALLPSVIAFGMSRLFDMISELLACVGRIEEDLKRRQEIHDEHKS